ncbi:thiopeptide-type bacteriocin biosynthesis protein [Pedobacter cryoconitis]|uniref:lantibiotic dehydratase n=1 Tax=Pedobacter cryoconitis TaxID=188932 RepID=UPI00161FE634|nr:lantibiotic dehydratase [Pedobacter cryoconitis]MBB6272396.1 thiopeptide-type bacteriocin biosynthesis protein [Pedobacter cryoconitis]
MIEHYSICQKLVVRVARLPFKTSFGEKDILNLLHDEQFLEALYLASNSLYKTYQKWKQGKLNSVQTEKLLNTVTKYYVRMMSRSTPFGLFAGCSTVDIDTANGHDHVILNQQISRKTRLDMGFFKCLSDYITSLPYVSGHIKYHTNSSAYLLGEEIRYLEYKYVDGKRIYELSSIQKNPYLLKVLDLCRNQSYTLSALVPVILDEYLDTASVEAFIAELIEIQFLVDEFEPAITGQDPMLSLIEKIKTLVLEDPGNTEMLKLRNWLIGLNHYISLLNKESGSVSDYEHVISIFNERVVYDTEKEPNKFQVDYAAHFSGAISSSFEESLLEAANVISVFTATAENSFLQSFKNKFTDRYGDLQVPLLEALDVDYGIGYKTSSGDSLVSEIVDGLSLGRTTEQKQDFSWNNAQKFLFAKWKKAYQENSPQLEITEDEISGLLQDRAKNNYPQSFSILFRSVKAQMVIESIGGSSAVNLIGRFTAADPNIYSLAEEIVNAEEQNNRDIVFCEIVHLPQDRVANILMHPPLLKHEIPYLSQSTAEEGKTLYLSDLLLSVENDRIILRHKDLQHELIPRLSNAHNFSKDSLPLYNFLADLQTQGVQDSIHFSWDDLLPDLGFYPRVVYKNVIIYPSTWKVFKKQYAQLSSTANHELSEVIVAFAAHLQLPPLFLLKDGDNELLVDIHNIYTVHAFISAIKNRDSIILREFIFDERSSPVKDNEGNGFYNQMILSVINKERALPHTLSAETVNLIQNEFSLGSEWLYYKFYCGEKTSDTILLQAISLLVDELGKNEWIDQWFFIRYKDPNNHLRVRFHLKHVQHLGAVISVIQKHICFFQQEKYIWNTQTETYKRELKRYGYQLIYPSEEAFYQDSKYVLRILEEVADQEDELLKLMACVKGAADMLNCFGLSVEDKIAITGEMRDAYFKEFNGLKKTKQELDSKYRTLRPEIEAFFKQSRLTDAPLHLVLNERFAALNAAFDNISWSGKLADRNNFITSHIHMFVNRLFNSNQRKIELVVYELLTKFLSAENKRVQSPLVQVL